jgi:hypothetical protein
MRVVYTATGGETSVSLSALNGQFSYVPGAAQIDVKRSSGGSLIAGVDFFETSTTTIGFPSSDPLVAGELVEVTRNVAVTGVMALSPAPYSYKGVATAGQTLIAASFSWPYNLPGAGGMALWLHGVRLTPGIDYTEVNLGSANTNQVTLLTACVGGENILMQPTFNAVDSTSATSTFNSTQLSNIQTLLTAGTQAFVDTTSLISVPSTLIQNRAQIPDITNDLRPSFGIERIPVQSIYQLQTEFGANGEPVYAAANDTRGLIRFVGSWTNPAGTSGSIVQASTLGTDYAEITFYGTGLNLLIQPTSTAMTVTATTDGGTANTILSAATFATTLAARNYAPNQVLSAVQGLSLGIHTVKIASTGTTTGLGLFGFEILNAASATNVNVNPGKSYANGQYYQAASAQPFAYTAPVTGTRGGRVVVYQTASGAIAQAFTPTSAAAAYTTSASHANEEIARAYDFREFGAGRADDFSLLGTSAIPVAFALDDGTTTLTGTSANTSTGSSYQGVEYLTLANSAYLTLTFVGTGLDVLMIGSTGATLDSSTVYVDGASQGTITSTQNKHVVTKICSGLPYGTHTVSFQRTAIAGFWGIRKFIVYQPKTPAIPAGSVQLGSYNVLATYASTGSAANRTISTGVMRKLGTRENSYVGTWSTAIDGGAYYDSGVNIYTQTAGSYTTCTFFGTGIELKFYIGTYSYNQTVTVANSSGNLSLGSYTTALLQTGSGLTWTASSGAIGGSGTTGNWGRLQITGLPLGLYTFKILQNGTGGPLYSDSFDIITPIYSPKSNLTFDAQNTLPVGSCALSDDRQTTMVKSPQVYTAKVVTAVGVVSNPSTSSTTPVPCPDMCTTYQSSGEWVELYHYCHTGYGGLYLPYFNFYVDGVATGILFTGSNEVTAGIGFVTGAMPVYLAPGTHKIDVYWYTGGGTLSAIAVSRVLTVKKLGN